MSKKYGDLEHVVPVGTDTPNIPKAFTDYDDSLSVAPKQIVGATKKQLLIANSSGVVTAVTASGDLTNDEAGVFTIEDEAVTPEKLSEEAKPFTWYTPKVIATEESRTNTAFGTLTTADEIKEVVMPPNGLIVIGYVALWKSSSTSAGHAAIFLGSNQLEHPGITAPEVSEIATSGTNLAQLESSPFGLSCNGEGTSFVTTGMPIANPSSGATAAGLCVIYAAAGTYNISVQFKAASGSVTAKERKLWVATLG